MRRAVLVLIALLLLVGTFLAYGQTTGTLTLLPQSGGVGTITTVGDCSTDPCFQAEAAGTFLGAPLGGGVAAFRAITEADLPGALATDLELTAAVSAHAADADAHHVWPLAISDLSDVSENGAAAGEALVADGAGAWSPSAGPVCLEDGTNCPAGGANPAGSGSELQYRSDASTFGAVTGSSVSGGAVTLSAAGSPLIVGATAEVFRVRANSGGVNSGVRLSNLNTGGVDLEMHDDSGSPNFRRLIERFDSGSFLSRWSLSILDDPGSAWTAQNLLLVEHSGDPKVTSTAPFRGPAGSASVPSHSFTTDSDSGLYSTGANDVGLAAGAVRGLGQTATETTLYVEQVASPSTQTCTDSGNGSPGALTVTVSGVSLIFVSVSDADGCTLTLSETGATSGQRLELIVTTANTATLSDTAGVSETPGAVVLGQWDGAILRYVTDRFVYVGGSDN